ncbi:hypothetical protein OS242_16515 [Tumebacillus sp. DT12]|uniref:Uncharacterized protein n=1 Tax=Tumebacillus lacus TaxID=2995335 RepID=A0ABT3X6F8_9BACL|nr:hypothetical protein [Tumebacillus lacus]MCX7571553.1 hypothetical protein [Tumebacillus lacus]
MQALRQWLRKVTTGLAAFLLSCVQILGTVDLTGMAPYGYGYMWTDYGMKVQMMEEEERRHAARLEGDVHEDIIRQSAQRERNNDKKAVS